MRPLVQEDRLCDVPAEPGLLMHAVVGGGNSAE